MNCARSLITLSEANLGRRRLASPFSSGNLVQRKLLVSAFGSRNSTNRYTDLSIFRRAGLHVARRPHATKTDGYKVSNQIRIEIHQIGKVGEILDSLVSAGATDVGNVEFLVSDPSKALDAAREAAIADALRRAEVYAKASDLRLGRVVWITEDFRIVSTCSDAVRGRPGADGHVNAYRHRRKHIAS